MVQRRAAMTTPPLFVAYYRVSRERQVKSGLSLEFQKASSNEYATQQSGKVIAEFTEQESGRKSDRGRPKLRAALALCRSTGAILLIATLDRLARNVAFVSALMESDVKFVCIDMPFADRVSLHMRAVFAEWEWERDRQRLIDAFAARKARGIPHWTHLMSKAQHKARSRKAGDTTLGLQREYAQEMAPEIDQLRRRGISSYDELADALNARGYVTRSGKPWTPKSLQATDLRRGTWSIRKHHSLTINAILEAKRLAPIIREIQRSGLKSQREIADELNRRKILCPRGGRWQNGRVCYLLPRIEMVEQPGFFDQLATDTTEFGRSIVRSVAHSAVSAAAQAGTSDQSQCAHPPDRVRLSQAAPRSTLRPVLQSQKRAMKARP